MQEHFRLGIFTSATQRTVGNVLPLLEQAAGPGTPLFADPSLILHRSVGLLPWNLPTCLPSSCAEQSMQSCHGLRCIETSLLVAQCLFWHNAVHLQSSKCCDRYTDAHCASMGTEAADGAVATAAAAGIVLHLKACDLVGSQCTMSVFSYDI